MNILFDNIVYFLGGIAIGTLMAYIAEAIDNYREERNNMKKTISIALEYEQLKQIDYIAKELNMSRSCTLSLIINNSSLIKNFDVFKSLLKGEEKVG